MAKKKKKKKKIIPARKQTLQELVAQVDSAIQAKRDRKALALAKQLQRHPEFTPDYLALLIRAYELRIYNMLQKKQFREAEDMYNSCLKHNPGCIDLFSTSFLVEKALYTNSPGILARYGSDTDATSTINDYLTTRLTDLKLVADYTHFPDQQDLKQPATILLEAWEEVEAADRTGSAFREMLQQVGRHSPLVNWRLFIQGLNAFYINNDLDAEDCLNRINPASVPYRAAGYLLDIIQQRTPATTTGRQLVKRICGDSLGSLLEEADQFYARGSLRQAEQKICTVLELRDLEQKQGLRNEIGALMAVKCEDHEYASPQKIIRYFRDPLFLMISIKRQGEDIVEFWEDLLDRMGRNLKAVEKALVYSRMAQRIIQDLPDGSFPFFMHFIRSHLNQEKKELLMEASDYWERSCAAYPLEETYRNWFTHTCNILNEQQAEKVLEKWHNDFPEAVEPLVLLTNSCRKRGVYKKALRFFSRLDSVARGNPEVEAIRNYIYLDDTIYYLTRQKWDKARQQLEKVRQEQTAFIRAVVTTLRWYLGHQDGGDFRVYEKELIDLQQPASVYHIVSTLAVKHKLNLPKILEKIDEPMLQPDLLVNDFYTLLQLTDPAWEVWTKGLSVPQVRNCFLDTTVAAYILRTCLEFFTTTDRNLNHPVVNKILWHLTANGIRRNDEHLGFFLAHRGILLHLFLEDDGEHFLLSTGQWKRLNKQLELCLTAAYWLARQSRNLNDLHQLKQLLEMHYLSDEGFDEPDESFKRSQVDEVIQQQITLTSREDLLQFLKVKRKQPRQHQRSKPGPQSGPKSGPKHELPEDDPFEQQELF